MTRSGRPLDSVRFIAVGKGKPPEALREAYLSGLRDFGENFAQELVAKAAGLQDLPIVWHFLGHLQKNKINKIVPWITWLHSLDSWELALALEGHLNKPLGCLVEVKFGGEPRKSGVAENELFSLIEKLSGLKKVSVKGFMVIPPLGSDATASRPYFRKTYQLLKEINERKIYPERLTELSMGMSHDFEVAIEEGATMVRIGTAIFGERL